MFEDLFLRNKDYILRRVTQISRNDEKKVKLYLQNIFLIDEKTIDEHYDSTDKYIIHRYYWKLTKSILFSCFFIFLVGTLIHYIFNYTSDTYLYIYAVILSTLGIVWLLVSILERLSEKRMVDDMMRTSIRNVRKQSTKVPRILDKLKEIESQLIEENKDSIQENYTEEEIENMESQRIEEEVAYIAPLLNKLKGRGIHTIDLIEEGSLTMAILESQGEKRNLLFLPNNQNISLNGIKQSILNSANIIAANQYFDTIDVEVANDSNIVLWDKHYIETNLI